MSTNKHTPGPWEVSSTLGRPWEVRDASHEVVAESKPSVVGMPWAIANARLIAAAPDLLEACRLALEWADGEHGEGPMGCESANMLRAAITRAEGGAA